LRETQGSERHDEDLTVKRCKNVCSKRVEYGNDSGSGSGELVFLLFETEIVVRIQVLKVALRSEPLPAFQLS
jgi:hypothetical protein